ncbi:Uncharacterised protein [Mycobacteroides abscessus subsp. abscessus]|nr:Uncharacterised protein [Mycobacteroides abscessus subsp. abscessus]
MCEEQFDGVVLGDPPIAGLTLVGTKEVGILVDDPGARLPVQEVLTVMTDDDLLCEVVVGVGDGIVSLALATPHSHER